MLWNYPKIFYAKIFYLGKTVKVENVRRFTQMTIHREVHIRYCICDKLTINLSEDETELSRIVQRAVLNETALTMS